MANRQTQSRDMVNDTVGLVIVREGTNGLLGHCGAGKHEVLPGTETLIGVEKKRSATFIRTKGNDYSGQAALCKYYRMQSLTEEPQ